MTKKNKKEVVTEVVIEIEKPDFFKQKRINYYLIAILFLILSISFWDIAFRGFVPQAVDTMQWRNSAQCQMEYKEEHGKQGLWNANTFAGMPGYLIHFEKVVPFIDHLKNLTDTVMNWRILLLFLAGLGMYILMIHLQFEPLIAFIAAISFALSCHFIGLIEIGHNTKFRSIVYLPWIFWAIRLLHTKRNMLAFGLTALFLIGQIRENHPQIAYYTYIMIAIYWVVEGIGALKEKQTKPFIQFTVLLLLCCLITLLAIAQPYLSIQEYGEYSIRGGAEGVGKEYATSWSFHPLEMLSFIIPDFFGGVSPYYWGWMPFTQTSMYMGIVILFFAILALFCVKSRMIKFLGWLCLITLFFSFGKHFDALSTFLLAYLPGFNKFRVPATILVLLQFAIVVLAAYGIQFTASANSGKSFLSKHIKKIFIAGIILFLLFAIVSSAFQQLSFMKTGESERYSAEQLNQLKLMRYDKLINDGYLALLFLIGTIGAIFLWLRKKISRPVFLILIALLSFTDLIRVNKRFLQKVTHYTNLEREFQTTRLDKFLLEDSDLFRIYPLASEFQMNKWAYHHQTIGGYHGAKLQRYEDIISNCLNYELDYRVPINWNIVNMLNVKYLIFDQMIPLENLEYAFYDSQQKKTAILNKDSLPRAWFVSEAKKIIEKEAIWKELNNRNFNPKQTAIVEQDIPQIETPTAAEVQIIHHDLDNLILQTKNDSTSFLVISEIYYPAGWNAYINGEPTDIYATNYILRGIVVPAGEHNIELKFQPKSYTLGILLSWIGISITVLAILIGSLFFWRQYNGKKS
jgi:hypothetical protein